MILYKEYKPSQKLQNIVRCYYLFDCKKPTGQKYSEIVSPDGSFEINFRLSPADKDDLNIYYIALFSKYRMTDPSQLGKMVGVSFYPWIIFPMLKTSPSEIIDEKISFKDIKQIRFERLYEQIVNCTDVNDAILKIEDFILNLDIEPDPLVLYLCRSIINSKGIHPMPDYYEGCGISHRRIEQRFADNIGITAKFFSRLVRYRNSLSVLKNYSDKTLTQIAYDCGYYDQSHFIRDFNAFTGLSPAKYINTNHLIDDLNISSKFN